MTTTLKAARQALKTKLTGINSTTGGYALLDLSGTDQVQIGDYPGPWLPRAVHQACLYLSQDRRNAGPTLCGKSQVATFALDVWMPATADSAETREDAIMDAWADLTRCFRTQPSRTLGGIVTETEITLDAPLGNAQAHGMNWIGFLATFTVTFREALP